MSLTISYSPEEKRKKKKRSYIMNENDYHVHLNSLDSKRVPITNEKFIINSVLSYKHGAILKWSDQQKKNSNQKKGRSLLVPLNENWKEKKTKDSLKNRESINRNISNKTRIKQNMVKRRTIPLIKTNNRETIHNKCKNSINQKKIVNDKKQICTEYNESKKNRNLDFLKKTLVEKKNPTKITNKKKSKIKGTESVLTKENRETNYEKNLQKIKESKNILFSKNDKNLLVRHKKKKVEKKNLISISTKKKVSNDRMNKLSNIPLIHIETLESNKSNSTTTTTTTNEERTKEKSSLHSSSTHFINSDEPIKKEYLMNHHHNKDMIMLYENSCKNNLLMKKVHSIFTSKEVQETLEEIEEISDSEEDKQHQNKEESNKKGVSEQSSKEINHSNEVEEYSILHNNDKGSKSVNSLKEPNFFNSLIFTNELRLKMCYSNNFIDLKKIYFEKSIQEGNTTMQEKEGSSFFKDSNSLNSSELFSISLDTENTRRNDSQIKKNQSEYNEPLLEPSLPDIIKNIESTTIPEPYSHSCFLKGFTDSSSKEEHIMIPNASDLNKEQISEYKEVEPFSLITDEIKILQDKEMEILSKLILENGIYNELTQNLSSPEYTERRRNQSGMIQKSIHDSNEIQFSSNNFDSIRKRELLNYVEIQKEEESPIIDFIKIDIKNIHTHLRNNNELQMIPLQPQQQQQLQIEKPEFTRKKEMKTEFLFDDIFPRIAFKKIPSDIRLLDVSTILNKEPIIITDKKSSGSVIEEPEKKERSKSFMISRNTTVDHTTKLSEIESWNSKEHEETEEHTWNETEVEEVLKKEIVQHELKIGPKKKKKQRKQTLYESSTNKKDKSYVASNKSVVLGKQKKEYKQGKVIVRKKERNTNQSGIKNDIREYHKRNTLLKRKILKNKISITKGLMKNRQEKDEDHIILKKFVTKEECALYNPMEKGTTHSVYNNNKLRIYQKKKKHIKKKQFEKIIKKTRKGKNEIIKLKGRKKKNLLFKNVHSITNINKVVCPINYDSSFFYDNPNIIYENCDSLAYMIDMMKHDVEFVMNLHKKMENNNRHMHSNNNNNNNKKNLDTKILGEEFVETFAKVKMNDPSSVVVNEPIHMMNGFLGSDVRSNKLYNRHYTKIPLKEESPSVTTYKHEEPERKEEEKKTEKSSNENRNLSTVLPQVHHPTYVNHRDKAICDLVKKNKKIYSFREEPISSSLLLKKYSEKQIELLQQESCKESVQRDGMMECFSKSNELKLWNFSHVRKSPSKCYEPSSIVNTQWNPVETKEKTLLKVITPSEPCVQTFIYKNEPTEVKKLHDCIENKTIKSEIGVVVNGLKYKEAKEEVSIHHTNTSPVHTKNHNYNKVEESHVFNESWIGTRENLSEQFALDFGKYVRNHRIIDLNMNKPIYQETSDKKNQTIRMNMDSSDSALRRTTSMKHSHRVPTKINHVTNRNHESNKLRKECITTRCTENSVVRKATLKKEQTVEEGKMRSIIYKTPSIHNFFNDAVLNKTYSYPVNTKSKHSSEHTNELKQKNRVGRNRSMINRRNTNAYKISSSKSMLSTKTSLPTKNFMRDISDIVSKVQQDKQNGNQKKEIFLMYQNNFNELSLILNTTKVYKKQKTPQPKLQRNKSMFVGKSFECLRKKNEEESKKRKIKNSNQNKIQQFNQTDMFCVKKERIGFFEKIKNFQLFKF